MSQRQRPKQHSGETGTSTAGYRSVPHNLEAERALLGSVLLDNSALDFILDFGLSPEDLFSDAHRIALQRMVDLAELRRQIDLVTLCEELSHDGMVEKVGGAAYLAALTDGVPIGTTAAVGEYCRIVKEKSTIRRVINASNNVIQRALEGTDDAQTLIDIAQAQMFEIAEQRTETGFQTVGEITKKNFRTIDALFNGGQAITGIESGLQDLDSMTSGFQNGELVVIASRPSIGKTSLALGIAAHASLKQDKHVGLFSLEMNKESLIMRLLCAEARIDSHKLRTGFSSRDDWNRVTPALGRLAGAPIYIDDSPALSIMQIRSKAERLKREKGVDLLIVDYLQLITGRGENRTQEVSYISRNLKSIAKELGVPVIALSQLSRAGDSRRGVAARPQLSDLRDGGSIEQDSDVVIFIYREKLKAEQASAEEFLDGGYETRLIIGKQRNGPTGDVPVVFLKAYAKFENKLRESTWYDGKAEAANAAS